MFALEVAGLQQDFKGYTSGILFVFINTNG